MLLEDTEDRVYVGFAHCLRFEDLERRRKSPRPNKMMIVFGNTCPRNSIISITGLSYQVHIRCMLTDMTIGNSLQRSRITHVYKTRSSTMVGFLSTGILRRPSVHSGPICTFGSTVVLVVVVFFASGAMLVARLPVGAAAKCSVIRA